MPKISDEDLVPFLSSHLLLARRTGAPAGFGDGTDERMTAELAYAVQAAVARGTGPVGGFKVANKPDAPRIMAPIFAADILTSPATLHVPGTEEIGIELEVGFRVEAPLPPRDVADRPAQVAGCISAVPVIEIVRTRLGPGAGPWLKLADNQINGGLVVGPAARDWQGLDLSHPAAILNLGADRMLDGPARVPGGDALANFLVLEEMVGNHCGGLRPGHLVITGSLNGLPYVRGDLAIEGEIAGLGTVSLDLKKV